MIINEIRDNINDYLKNYFNSRGSYNRIVYDSESYSLNAGGKRIRPLLLCLSYMLYKKDYKEVTDMAAAIEMIHTYSLIHDDLPCMDNDDFRRGMLTNHKKFGYNIAVLAGDSLLNEAMILMMKYSLEHGENALKASKIIAEAAGSEGMIGGQIVDIISEGQKISLDELKYMHKKKTGALIKAAVLSGAVLAGGKEDHLKILDKFGSNIGLAFQIRDDILDVIGDSKNLGKKTHADKEHDKTNFITEFGLEKCKKMCEDLTSESISLLDTLPLNTDNLKELTLMLLKREK
ncbi:polyprenyl synthetase family protein [Clostridium sp. BJN0001]|uniref:polyprenyl synthetase family protein n=1 Tax=Clostridium sp. BJN0001 TaxID=2930219 RepID=UPI001FD05AA7|nr:farnesyl diphosphate synthase [Clostridium sp. BJN0001]